MKGHFCADGSTQRNYIKKKDATFPTAHNTSVFVTLVIVAHERCKQAVSGVMRFFLTTDGNEDVIM